MNLKDNRTDERLLIKDARKNKEKFAVIYEKYKDRIQNFVKSKVSSKEVAEDITSTTFQKAFEAVDSFRWQGIPISAWLFRIARNQIIDHYRSDKTPQMVDIEETMIASTARGPEEEFIALQFEDEVRQLLINLPERESRIIYMKFFEGYTNKTISKLIKISETNVGTIIFRVMKKLKKQLTNQDGQS